MPIDDLPPIAGGGGIDDLPPIQPARQRGAFEGIFNGGDEAMGSGGSGLGGVLERSGIRIVNSLGNIGGGFLRLGESAAREVGFEDTANAIDRFADARDAVGSRAIRGVAEGGTEVERAQGLGQTASALARFVGTDPAGFAGYAAENVLGSAPDMLGAALAPYAYFASRGGSSGAARAENDGRGQTQFLDVLKASPGTAAEVALERFATRNIGSGGLLSSAAREGGTEFGQNLAQYTAETAGTKTGFDLDTGLGQGLQGAAIGVPAGAAFGVPAALAKRGGARSSAEPAAAGPDFEGSLDDFMRQEQGGQGIDDLPPMRALPSPTVYVDSAGDAAIGARGQQELERIEAVRRMERGRPEPVTGDAAIEAYMARARGVESSGNDAERNPNSSATGRYQFIDGTWLNLYKQRYGDQGLSDAQILAKRNDGDVQDVLMRDFTSGNARALKRAGVPITEGNLYLAHFAGIGGALKLHRANPNARVETVLSRGAVAANPFLRGKTASDVVAWAAGKMGSEVDIGAAGGGFDVPDFDVPDVPGADGELLIDNPELARRADIPKVPIEAPTPIEIPEARLGQKSEVTTARGDKVDTQFAVVDAADITTSANPAYLQALQPRDRAARGSSEAQIAQIAGNLDPAQLADSRLASTGAPIIGPDGMVESGNGRTLAIERAYQTNPQGAAAYRQMIESQGFDTTGMARPILVRRRNTPMTPEQRLAWTRAANERDTMAMSSTEQAAADAGNLSNAALSLYRGGALTAAANRDFVRNFVQSVSPSERNAMTAPDGSLSVDGIRRIQSALLSKAYGDTNVVARITEDADSNVVAIGKALTEAAPAFARLKASIAAGDLPAQYDVTGDISKAAQMVARSREAGQSIAGMLAQIDAFSDRTSPETEQVLRLFFRDEEFKRPRSGTKIADALIDYVARAERVKDAISQGSDIFGNAPELPSPASLLEQSRVALDGEAQPDLLATGRPEGDGLTSAPENATVPDDGQGNRPLGSARRTEAGNDRAGRSNSPVLARGQLRGLGIAREIQTKSTASLLGRNVGSAQEMAQIAQVFRDPRYETLRIFYTKGSEIVHTTGISTRDVSSVPFSIDGSRTDEQAFYFMRATMVKTGADGYFLLHNHPSGDPDPSVADKNLTVLVAKAVRGFRGHIVINSNKYAEINAKGNALTHDIEGAPDTEPAVQHSALSKVIRGFSDVVAIGKELQKPGYVTVIGTTSKGKVRVILDYDPAKTRSDKELAAIMRRIGRNSGASHIFLVGDRASLDVPVVKRALRDKIILSAIDTDGKEIYQYHAGRRKPIPEGLVRQVKEGSEGPYDPDYGMDRQRRLERDEAERLGITPLQAKRRMEARDFIRRSDPRAAKIMDLRENPAPFIREKLIDGDGLKRDAKAIRKIVGNPRETLKSVGRSGFADVGRWAFYTMDSRMRQMAERYNSAAINDLADIFHSRAGKMDKAVGETYHEAVDREGFGRASKAWQILAPFQGDKSAMERIGLMLRDPSRRSSGKATEVKAAADIAALLKDTIDYRKKAGEDIGEVTDGYFPRWMNVEKVITKQDLFRQRAEQLYQRHGLDADAAKAAASAWMARIVDQYAGLDGGLEYASLFRDTRPAGVGRKTTKAREFGKDADKLLGDFYQNDTGEVITAYMIGAARKAEEARRFGIEGDGRPKLRAMMERIKKQVRESGEDAGEALDVLAKMVNTNLGRIDTAPGSWRNTASLLQTASQLGTLDRATYTSLSEAMMGFVRAGPKYGLPMLRNTARQFARQLRNAPPDEAQRMAEALGIATDVMVSEALAARSGYEMSTMTRRAQKVQQGFFRATGLHQWTEGSRIEATRMGQKFVSDLAADLDGPRAAQSAGYLRELGVKNPKEFAAWLRESGGPSPEAIGSADADMMTQQYRTALMRFVNQTIMKPSRAEKPSWASHPVGSLFFSLMSFSYGYKKNVLDRIYRTSKEAIKTKDPTLLYPAFGMAGLFAVHSVLNSIIRPMIFGGGREEEEDEGTLEGLALDALEAADRAGITGAASRPLNALWGLRYRQGIIESMMGPVIGRPADLIEKTYSLATDANSKNTNSAERAAAGALYDVVLEPAFEAYAIGRLNKTGAAAAVWGSGNREGGVLPSDREFFIEAVAGEKAN